jgi:inner membrane protein
MAVVCVLVLDRIISWRSWPLPVLGLLDETAHLVTACIALAAFAPARRQAWLWVLLGSVGIDIDHVPVFLFGVPVAEPGGRPVTHSLLTAAVFLILAAAVPKWRTATACLAAGVLIHLTRDLVTGPGVPLWWPLPPDSVLLPYWLYILLLTVLAGVAVTRRLLMRSRAAPGLVTEPR